MAVVDGDQVHFDWEQYALVAEMIKRFISIYDVCATHTKLNTINMIFIFI